MSCKTGEALADVAAQARETAGAAVAKAEELKAQVLTGARTPDGVLWQSVANLAPDDSWLERVADARVDRIIQDSLRTESAAEADAQALRQGASRDAAAIRATGEDACQLLETVRVTADRTQRDTIAGAVTAVDATLDEAGRRVKAASDYGPVAGAALGGTVAANAGLNPVANPAASSKLGVLAWTASELSERASPAAAEATQRHLMADTVLPSLQADTEAMERDARARLEAQREAPQAAGGPFDDPYLNRAYAALLAGDSDSLDRIADDFAKSPEGQRLAQLGDELLAQQQATEQSRLQEQQRSAPQPEMATSR